ncbi:hypothetical protein ThvES_00016830 [Thiovulum sp. ES]|nr:hypothetical protein ThvES_00016830 [Thiovulum sp. ES]
MFSKLSKAFLATSVVTALSFSFAEAKQLGAELWGTAGNADETFQKTLVPGLAEKGFIVSDPHPYINMGYAQMFGSTKLDNLGFFSIAHNDKIRTLLEKYPALGGFTPFNLHIYKTKTENTTYVGHLRPEVMADIVGLKDEKLRREFVSMFPELDKYVRDTMGSTSVKNIYFDTLPENPMMTFTVDIDLSTAEDDLEYWVELFQEEFEENFEEKGYLIAGFKNISDIYDVAGQDFKYPAYWVYSLCDFPFSNAIFNDVPEAGIFAPCSLYMYIDEDEKQLHIGMPKLANWKKIIGITDPEKVKLIDALDEKTIESFQEIGAKLVK